jgi:cell division protein FtsN
MGDLCEVIKMVHYRVAVRALATQVPDQCSHPLNSFFFQMFGMTVFGMLLLAFLHMTDKSSKNNLFSNRKKKKNNNVNPGAPSWVKRCPQRGENLVSSSLLSI